VRQNIDPIKATTEIDSWNWDLVLLNKTSLLFHKIKTYKEQESQASNSIPQTALKYIVENKENRVW